MLDEQEGNFARLQLACSDGIRSPECVAGLGWERGRQSAAALRLFLGCTTNSYSPFFAALRLQLLPEVASDFPLGPKIIWLMRLRAGEPPDVGSFTRRYKRASDAPLTKASSST